MNQLSFLYFFCQVKFGFVFVMFNVGFVVELDVLVKGEVDDKEEEVFSILLQLGGEFFVIGVVEIGIIFYMNGMWRKVFGLLFFGIGNIQIG